MGERRPARAMTFLHAANCLAVVFVPPWMIYQYKLKEYCESSGALVRAGFWYAAVQLVQLILVAQFVPVVDSGSFDVVQELMKAVISMCDCAGLYYHFEPKRMAQGAALGIGLAWGTAESVLNRLVPLAVQARGLQFSWKHTLTSVEANISLCSYMALAVLMRLWVREPSKRTSIAVLVGMQRLVAPVIASYIRHAPFDEAPAASVLAQLMTMLVFAFAAFRVTSS